MGLIWSTKRVSKRKRWARDRESCILSSRVCVISMLAFGVNVLGNSPAFDCPRSVSVFICRSPPEYPSGGDTVATSGFPRLPLCFPRDRWTAEFWRSWTGHCPEFVREAMTSTYRLFYFFELGVKLLRFLFIISKIMIGVKWRERWNDALM